MAKKRMQIDDGRANLPEIFQDKQGYTMVLKTLLEVAQELEVEDHLGVGYSGLHTPLTSITRSIV